jgi:RNA polymerase sigma-70 factor (ECF subfamily)
MYRFNEESMAQKEALALEINVLARAVQGDEEAFADLLRRHQRMVFSVAWHFFHDRALAEDLAQDVFLQFYQNLASIASEAHLVSWLRRVAVRKCIDYGRSKAMRCHLRLEDIDERPCPASTPDILENARVRRLVAGLPDKFRAVVILRFQENLALAEIAQTLGWPINSVKSKLHRALKMLRERLEK